MVRCARRYRRFSCSRWALLFWVGLLLCLQSGCQPRPATGLCVNPANNSIVALDQNNYFLLLRDTEHTEHWYAFDKQTWSADYVSVPAVFDRIELIHDGRFYARIRDDTVLGKAKDTLYSCKPDGSSLQQVMQSQSLFSMNLFSYGGVLYYTDYGLYRCNSNGSGRQLVLQDGYILQFSIDCDRVYYVTVDIPIDYRETPNFVMPPPVLKAYDLNTREMITLFEGIHNSGQFIVSDGYLVYIDPIAGRLYQIHLETMERKALPKDISTQWRVDGGWLYWIEAEEQNLIKLSLRDGRREAISIPALAHWDTLYDDFFVWRDDIFLRQDNILGILQEDGSVKAIMPPDIAWE